MIKSSFDFDGTFSSKQKNANDMVINSSNLFGSSFSSDASAISMIISHNISVSEITNDLGKIIILTHDYCIVNEPTFSRHFWKLSIQNNIFNIKTSL